MGLALAAGGVLTFFFLWGLADGSLYGDAGFFFLFVALAWGLIAASFALRRRKVPIVPLLLLLPLVFPAVMYGLIIVIFMLSGESWR
jgi:ABC-type molybdate transport system permease subunit